MIKANPKSLSHISNIFLIKNCYAILGTMPIHDAILFMVNFSGIQVIKNSSTLNDISMKNSFLINKRYSY